MPQHDLVVIGGSAGGLQALSAIVQALPATLPASVLVVVHSSSTGPATLPEILERISLLPVAFAADGDRLAHGRIYIARSNLHLVVEARGLTLGHGPRENGFRPAIDPLFRTAAREHGRRVIGVVLSGALSDGTYGLSMIKQCGGIAVVQDPAEAIIPSMPQSAIQHVDVDHILPSAEIGKLIDRLTRGPASRKRRPDMAPTDDPEPQLWSEETEPRDMNRLFGPPSALTCPDCGGALWEVQRGRVVRYQCHVGHQYAPENLDAGQRDAVDTALWTALRVLEEHVELKNRMSKRAADGGLKAVAQGYAESAREARQQALRIRAALFTGEAGGGAKDLHSSPQLTGTAARKATLTSATSGKTATPVRRRTKKSLRRG